MGQTLSGVFGRASIPEQKLLILGIDGAGKTTIFQRLTSGTTEETGPTQGVKYSLIFLPKCIVINVFFF